MLLHIVDGYMPKHICAEEPFKELSTCILYLCIGLRAGADWATALEQDDRKGAHADNRMLCKLCKGTYHRQPMLLRGVRNFCTSVVSSGRRASTAGRRCSRLYLQRRVCSCPSSASSLGRSSSLLLRCTYCNVLV